MLLQLLEPGAPSTHQDETPILAVGIDLGTTNSVVALAQNQRPVALAHESGNIIVPSVVAYPEGQAPIAGVVALELLQTNPQVVVSSIKRLMGRSAEDIGMETNQSYVIEQSQTSTAMVRLHIGGQTKTPIEISADILRALKDQAEKAIGQPIAHAVITVPAYFDEGGRQATKDAAQLAGLTVLRLINEPTAAALAYGLDQGAEGIYAIYDLGGGTFDISLLKLTKGVFQVLATGGNTALGGDDFDHLIVQYFQEKSKVKDLTDTQYKQALLIARQAKEHLSFHESGFWALPGQSEPIEMTRTVLNTLCSPLIEQTLNLCQNVLHDADLVMDDIKGVVLVGGSTRMPLLRDRIGNFFRKSPLTNLNPDEIVALGASLQAEALTRGSNTLLLDVTPLSLGLETMGGLVEKIIPRNTPIPATIAQEFTTYQDGQMAMKIHVVQGERELVMHCRSLGEFILSGIPPLIAGAARILVTFSVDVDGLLTVTATEKTTGIHQKVEVKPAYGLTEEDLHRILLENAQRGAQDMEERLLIESRVEGRHLIDALNAALIKDSDLLSEKENKKLRKAMTNMEQLLTESNREAIVDQHKELEELTQSFAEKRVNRSIRSTL